MFNYNRTGTGTFIYVIDSCVFADHADFGDRVIAFIDATSAQQGNEDCSSHGTQVASVAAGRTYGVAKGASIISVGASISNPDGSTTTSESDLINALNLARLDIVNLGRSPAVVNISLGVKLTGSTQAMKDALDALAQVAVVVISANDAVGSASDAYPAQFQCTTPQLSVIVVAASTITDTRHNNSGYDTLPQGTCVDIFAPGADIRAANNLSVPPTVVESGTSFAAPHVAGVAALYLEVHPTAEPDNVKGALRSNATTVSTLPNDPLLHLSATLVPPLPPPTYFVLSSRSGSSATFSWTAGDLQASTVVERKVESTSNSWPAGITLAPGMTSVTLSALAACTTYDVRLRHWKSNVPTSEEYIVPHAFNTMTSSGGVCQPAAFTLASCQTYQSGGQTFANYTLKWTDIERFKVSAWDLLRSATSSTANGSIVKTGKVN